MKIIKDDTAKYDWVKVEREGFPNLFRDKISDNYSLIIEEHLVKSDNQ